MANRYVWSGAAGSGNGSSWANAHTTFAAAITAGAAGDTYYVAHDHAESQASSLTLTFKGTFASPDRILCVNRAGSVPPVAADIMTGANVTTTGASSISLGGIIYCRGVRFNAGTGANNPSYFFGGSNHGIYDNCVFHFGSTGGSCIFHASGGATRLVWLNCSISVSHVSQSINPGGNFTWVNDPSVPPVIGATLPNTLIASLSSAAIVVLLRGLDLSALGSGKTIVGGVSGSSPAEFKAVNCKLHPVVTLCGALNSISPNVDFIGCDSGGSVARSARHTSRGVLTTETTIVRSAGAGDGLTPYSWKIVPDADNESNFPFETFSGSIFAPDAASPDDGFPAGWEIGDPLTLTVHCVTDGVTLTDAEIWLEADYLGDAAYPNSTRVNDGIANVLAAPADQAASTEPWTTTGLAAPTKQKLEVTFTPQMVGLICWRVKYAKTSTTVYVCPKAELS